MEKNKKLDDYFPGKSLRTCCALTGRTDDFIVEKDKQTNNEIFPYLEGSKGIAYKFAKTNPFRGGNGKTPQIKISDLKIIPIAVANDEDFNKIIDLTDKLQEQFNESEYSKLNKLVYKIYGISEEQEENIEKAMI